ncbi:MAG TPA: flavin reductase family protein [Roseiarcus sp.]|nr:flavin reductase family protein [Roseiarcus sp.]
MALGNVVAIADFETHTQAVAAVDFREVMRELASGVALVTSAFDEARCGCAVSSFASLSLEPASLLVCLNGESATLRCIRASRVFAVNILADRHRGLAQRFASAKVRGAERFAEGDWSALQTGAPALRDALAVVDCRLERIVEHATHAIVIGVAAEATKIGSGRALVHWRSRFETLA